VIQFFRKRIQAAIPAAIAAAISAGLLLIALLASPPAINAARAASDALFKEIKWEMLVPKGWDPAKQFKALDLSKLSDADPKAMDALQAMRTAWDNAPAEPAMNGRNVRIPGFMIPLDRTGESVRSFLLVPYFGACIHSPPPPSNQMIHVVLAKPVSGFNSMDAVWVNGSLEVERSDSPWGKTAYVLKALKVEAYKR
jgi:hypothetical protein